jgi:ATP-dependent helicase/nuclease subunit A
VLHLSQNFRSSDQVVDGVNAVFEAVMPNYDENARLKAGKGVSRPDLLTEFCLLTADSFPDLPDISGREAEAEYTARRIKQMIADSETSPPKAEMGAEALRYGDFAVISSTGETVHTVYEEVFRRHGIPCVSAGGRGYLKTEEVGLALDLLTVIDNPYNDLSLFKVMMSPMYGFAAEEIAAVRGNRNLPLYSDVLAAGRGSPDSRLAAFLATVTRYRRIADVCSVSELIAVINGEGAFLPLLTDGHKVANVRLLSYYAQQFTANRTDSSLSAFLAYVDELKKSGVDVRQANVSAFQSEAAGCVKLMTIHGSKGLEFPVCFVANTTRNYTLGGGGKSALVGFCDVAGIVADYFDEGSACRYKTLLSEYARRLELQADIAEEMRKLYVAATRAELKLIFTGYSSLKDGKIAENSYANWIDGAVGRVGEVVAADSGGAFADTPSVPDTPPCHADFAVYSRDILRRIPRKLTATQVGVEWQSREESQGGGVSPPRGGRLQRPESDEPTLFPRNPSFYGGGRLTGKKRGDAYHKVMELIDFSEGDYAEQLGRLSGRFTPAEFRAVDPRQIARFFQDSLAQRAVKSAESGGVIKEYKLYTEIALSDLGSEFDLSEYSDRPFIQGIADMFFYEDGEIVLVDYKTNRNTSAEKLRRDYGGQLAVYKKAIEEMTGRRVKECWLYSFELGAIAL